MVVRTQVPQIIILALLRMTEVVNMMNTVVPIQLQKTTMQMQL